MSTSPEVPLKISPELDYKKEKLLHPSYRMNRIFAQSGSTSTSLTSSGGNESIYEIPINPFNLNKSYFTFDALIPTPTHYIYVYRDVFSWWRQLQIYTRAGVYLMDLNELANYTKFVWKPELSLLEFLDLDTDTPAQTDAGTTGASAMLQRSN